MGDGDPAQSLLLCCIAVGCAALTSSSSEQTNNTDSVVGLPVWCRYSYAQRWVPGCWFFGVFSILRAPVSGEGQWGHL